MRTILSAPASAKRRPSGATASTSIAVRLRRGLHDLAGGGVPQDDPFLGAGIAALRLGGDQTHELLAAAEPAEVPELLHVLALQRDRLLAGARDQTHRPRSRGES